MLQITPHYERVRKFMIQAKQIPAMMTEPTVPDAATRILRAKLILEEALETVNALGVTAYINGQDIAKTDLGFEATHEPNLVEIADGCADVMVVTTGTLIACNIEDRPLLEAVDQNNLAKFGPGHSFREDGKLIKPPGHKPPDIAEVLRAQGWEG